MCALCCDECSSISRLQEFTPLDILVLFNKPKPTVCIVVWELIMKFGPTALSRFLIRLFIDVPTDLQRRIHLMAFQLTAHMVPFSDLITLLGKARSDQKCHAFAFYISVIRRLSIKRKKNELDVPNQSSAAYSCNYVSRDFKEDWFHFVIKVGRTSSRSIRLVTLTAPRKSANNVRRVGLCIHNDEPGGRCSGTHWRLGVTLSGVKFVWLVARSQVLRWSTRGYIDPILVVQPKITGNRMTDKGSW